MSAEVVAPIREFELREVPDVPGQAIVMGRHNGGRWVDLAFLSPQTNADWFVEVLRAGAKVGGDVVASMNRQQRREAARAATRG